jgi:hypothetical protein
VHWIVETSKIKKVTAAHGKPEWEIPSGTLVIGHYGPKWDKELAELDEKTVPWEGVSRYRREIEQWMADMSPTWK